MWLANLVGKVPFNVRLSLVIAFFVVLLLLAGPIIFRHLGLWLVLIFLIFFDRVVARTEHKRRYSGDVLAEVSVNADTLKVGNDHVETKRIHRIAVGRWNDKHGYLQFPFNPKFPVSLYFPVNQTEPLRKYLQEKLPQVTIVD